jgi:large-conductance mechanosensitive channel
VLVGLFAAINWDVFTALTPISLGFTTVQAPLGLIMLALIGFLCVLFTVWVIVLQANSLRDARRQTKELRAQRELADLAEASRFTELRTDLLKRLDENANATAAHIAQLEDRLERDRPLSPPAH